jgi:hypothetical protein
MIFRRRQRSFAAWLGLIGLAVQALAPLLLAVEIGTLSAAGFDPAAEAICTHSTGGDAPAIPAQHDPAAMAGCPICTMLAAAVVFTAPAAPGLHIPQQLGTEFAAHTAPPACFYSVAAAYNSRAPPGMG